MSEEFTAITTQEQLDGIIKERLKRDRETQAKRFDGWVSPEDHRKAVDAANKALSDYKKAHEDDEKMIADLTAKNKEYETASLKSRIAHEVGLSYEWISRISGEDEESIRSDAESLKELVGAQSAPPLPLKDPEPPADTKHTQFRTLLNNLNLKGD